MSLFITSDDEEKPCLARSWSCCSRSSPESILSQKENKLWLWKAYDRATGRCVAWTVGDRDTDGFRALWEKIKRDGCTYYTDDWKSYAELIPAEQHVIGKEHTCRIESDNSNTRHRVGRFTRRTKVVSKSKEMVDLTMRLWTFFEDTENFGVWRDKLISIFA